MPELELTQGAIVTEQLPEGPAHVSPAEPKDLLGQTRRCSWLLFACQIPPPVLLWEERADTVESLGGQRRLEAGSLGRRARGESLQGTILGCSAQAWEVFSFLVPSAARLCAALTGDGLPPSLPESQRDCGEKAQESQNKPGDVKTI